jgi:O-antigen/teichoic acid export membrane protein
VGTDAAAWSVNLIEISQRGAVARMFGSALAGQAILSAASFVVGLLLIRRSSDLQYGYYVLVMGAIILAVSLQNAFIAPAMINRMTRMDREQRGALTGGLYREQRHVVIAMVGIALAITLLFWIRHLFVAEIALLVLACIVAMAMALRREYFRMVLLAYRRAHDVLLGDVLYAVLLVIGIVLATSTPIPAVAAMLTLACAALIAGWLLSRLLRRREAWDSAGAPGILRQIAPVAAWSTAGAAIHWSFSQGYAVLAAATLDISAVAAIAATRMLAMPVTLLSTGIGSLMLPLTARWLYERGASPVLRRLLWIALAIGVVSVGYFGVLWLLRDWIFDVLLKKQFEQRDLLLLLWSASFVLTAVHQQLLWLLIARARFRTLTVLALLSAALALSCSYFGMLRFGGVGAPLGILVGELVNTVGIALLCLRELARPDDAALAAEAVLT